MINDYLTKVNHYILNENNEVIPATVMEWGAFFEKDRHVADTTIAEKDDTRVSTVFLGLDHGWSRNPDQPPVVFEAMVFSNNPDIDEYQERYSTYNEALGGHNRIVQFIKNGIPLRETRKTLKFNLKFN